MDPSKRLIATGIFITVISAVGGSMFVTLQATNSTREPNRRVVAMPTKPTDRQSPADEKEKKWKVASPKSNMP